MLNEKLIQGIAAIINDKVAEHEAANNERIKQLEKQIELLQQKQQVDITPIITAAVQKAIADIPAPQDGKDVDPSEVQRMVDEAVAAMPAAQDGKSVTIEEVEPVLQRMVDAIELPDPIPGEPGRDALNLEILPTIDTTKEYPRGTYAMHEGGFWRSYQTTQGLHGWECIVNGIAELEIDHDDDRTFTAKARLSDGTVKKKSISLPVVIDKGVFEIEREYLTGDGVTWGGSFWICQEDYTKDRPGQGDGWRLAVKKGRDGRDGKDGIDRTATVKTGGKDGKDAGNT